MLISITEKCRMGCPHCMDDAKKECDKFMSFSTFKKAVEFNLKYDPSIMITGGEPTEHREFWKFLDYLADTIGPTNVVTITSNSQNLDKDNGELLKKIDDCCNRCKGVIAFQITSVRGLYPYPIDLSNPIFKHKCMTICDSIEQMYPMGRAKGKNYDFSKVRASKCFNIRSLVRQRGFKIAVMTLRMMLKFCTPQIGYDGSIKVGESTLCPPVSHIDKSISEIEKDIRNFKCSGCKEIIDKLPKQYREAIGEE